MQTVGPSASCVSADQWWYQTKSSGTLLETSLSITIQLIAELTQFLKMSIKSTNQDAIRIKLKI